MGSLGRRLAGQRHFHGVVMPVDGCAVGDADEYEGAPGLKVGKVYKFTAVEDAEQPL